MLRGGGKGFPAAARGSRFFRLEVGVPAQNPSLSRSGLLDRAGGVVIDATLGTDGTDLDLRSESVARGARSPDSMSS